MVYLGDQLGVHFPASQFPDLLLLASVQIREVQTKTRCVLMQPSRWVAHV
jgi:hypothetical protein